MVGLAVYSPYYVFVFGLPIGPTTGDGSGKTAKI